MPPDSASLAPMTSGGSRLPLLRPNRVWPEGVSAAMSLRAGGVSAPPRDSLNLSLGVGDDTIAVITNRNRLTVALGVQPLWMRQVHGAEVMRLHAETNQPAMATADAAWTSERRVACTVGAADCMPVLFSLRDGRAVAAAHAGWRGLASGVLQATVAALCQGMGTCPADCMAWLGPCIGPAHFEVGDDVLQAFAANFAADDPRYFTPGRRATDTPDGRLRWLCNLPALATSVLQNAGVSDVVHSGLCTYSDASNFFSFRRDRVTGRHVACIWRQ